MCWQKEKVVGPPALINHWLNKTSSPPKWPLCHHTKFSNHFITERASEEGPMPSGHWQDITQLTFTEVNWLVASKLLANKSNSLQTQKLMWINATAYTSKNSNTLYNYLKHFLASSIFKNIIIYLTFWHS